MAVEAGSGRRRPRGPGFFYVACSLVMVLLVGVIAFTASQPPPPTIAEFAPQAIEQIKDAPKEQSSRFGSGNGKCEAGQDCGNSGVLPTVSPSPAPTINVTRVRRCIGDPPRQIEDPQSPPCVPYWDGDNGGATYAGVTRNEIRIAIPEWDEQANRDWEAFFNKRFEFYGRRVKFFNNNPERDETPARQKALAVRAAEDYKVFASTGYPQDGGFYYHEELTRRKLVSVRYTPTSTQDFLRDVAPYEWQYPMAADEMFKNQGQWVCRRLAKRNASYAGFSRGQNLATKQRVFGAVLQTYVDKNPVTMEPLERELSRCGVTLAYKATTTNDGQSDQNNDLNVARNIMAKMQQNGVTSLICLCLWTSGSSTRGFANRALGQAASSQQYHPEWIASTYFHGDISWVSRALGLPSDQRQHLFGLTFTPRQVARENIPWRWAQQEVSPTHDASSAGSEPIMFRWWDYQELLLLMSGLQMAGPNLTPETFERGLQRARFPNPNHPNMAGKVGFGPGRYTMTTDGAELWWSETARDPYDGQAGVFCYVDGGRRYRYGEWPTDPPNFFQGTCDSS